MNSNPDIARTVIARLISFGVSDFVICPGSFNSPFLAVLSGCQNVKIYNHFDERGAAFFAIGLSKQSAAPVCVCVTSGTAVAECLPAITEAYYAGNKLIVLSADREISLSGSGYPQAINQSSLLSSHTAINIDIQSDQDFDIIPDKLNFPVHFNVRFTEPILSPGFKEDKTVSTKKRIPENPAVREKSDSITSFLNDYKKPIVFVENIPAKFRNAVREFLLSIGAPIIAEARSGLRENYQLQDLVLQKPEITLSEPCFDCVLRIGSVPSSDLWRTLERDSRFNRIPVCSVSIGARYPGLSRQTLCLEMESELFKTDYSVAGESWTAEVVAADRRAHRKVCELMEKYPRSEAALVNWFSRQIPKNSFLYLGNSLPIREWNDFADRTDKDLIVDANRGANGIDGQVATFFGAALAAGRERNFALIGDLTFLYDLNSLALAKSLANLNFALGIINNNGGRIFEKLPYYQELVETIGAGSQFLNVHQFDFKYLAQGFNLHLQRISEPLLKDNLTKQVLLEIVPDAGESAEVNRLMKVLKL